MSEKITGEINLTHAITPDLSASIKQTTDDYSRLSVEYKINQNADIAVSTDSENKTNVALNVKV